MKARSRALHAPILAACLLLSSGGCGKRASDPGTTTATGAAGAGGPLTGLRVSSSDDLTGDGQPDVVISAPDVDGSGAVYIFGASVTGALDSSAAAAVVHASEAGAIGEGLGACGDIDGDGNLDLAIGQPVGNSGRGGLWVLSGPFGGEHQTDEGVEIRGIDDDAMAGYTISCGGDFDGDGGADVTFSAPMSDGFGVAEGTGQIFMHSSADGGATAVASFSTTWSEAQLGLERSLTLSHDLDGDGLDDLVVGSHGSARLYALFGPFVGTLEGNGTGTWFHGREDLGSFGYATAVGDLNGDGYPDIAASAPWFGPQYGAIGIIDGPLTDLAGERGEVSRWIDGQDPKEYTGFSLDIADDISGDGLPDLIAGAPGSTTSGPDAGVVYAIHGPADIGSVIVAPHVIVGSSPFARVGHSVAAVPDANGDGLDEVLVGAPYLDVGDRIGAGAALLYHSPLADRTDDLSASATFIF